MPTRREILKFAALLAAPPETTLILGGDVMLARIIGHLAREKHDLTLPFRDLAPLMSAADISFLNLESLFCDRGKPSETGMVFKAEPEMIAALKAAGIDVVSTANNHSRDRGDYGLEYNLKWLAQNGILAAGTGETAAKAHEGVVLVRHGVRFGFLAYVQDQTNGNYKDHDDRICDMDIPRLQQDVAAMKARAGVIVVSMHAGLEYWTKVHPIQTKFARAAIDAGAKVVVGHHPHVIQPWERYGSGVIFYSLGNLVFDQFDRKQTREGLLAEVVFAGAEIKDVRTIPTETVAGITLIRKSPSDSAANPSRPSP